MRSIDLESARLFLIAYEEGSLTRAAEKTNYAVSAVTKRIQDLEHRFGVTLFERHARGVVATPAGDELAGHMRHITHRLAVADQAMKEFANGTRGQIRVVATQSSIAGGLAELVSKYRVAKPDIKIDLIEVNGWSVISEITAGRADLGLTLSVVDVPIGFSVQAFKPVRLVAMVPEDHPLARQRRVNFDEMLEFEHVTLGPKSTLCALCVQQAADRGRVFRYHSVKSFDAMRSMISARLGIGILSSLMAEPYAETLRTVCLPIEEPWADRDIQVLYREDGLSTSAKKFKEFMLNPQAFVAGKS
ncbi:LysR family transcriptional regulator [Rhizobium mayense]|uniref:LysR family transcriptional regulator n=1 Tax=Rhizobium mayense TaxID=1312184 RepID=A0ABT7JRF9_9HYPH|nr:LysR family transcriptional regulator [Rhizobium mayense]MDL2398940.1 LysR family transcriptional regulator [Rhizobium mayense]